MKNIILTRIDDRLLHGQVIVSWIPYLNVNEVLIVDDEYSKDDFMTSLYKSAAPEHINVNILSVVGALEYLLDNSNNRRILVLLKNIENLERLIDSKVGINKVNLGGLGNAVGRKQYHNSLFLSEKEYETIKNIEKKGIEIEIKMLPKDKEKSLV